MALGGANPFLAPDAYIDQQARTDRMLGGLGQILEQRKFQKDLEKTFGMGDQEEDLEAGAPIYEAQPQAKTIEGQSPLRPEFWKEQPQEAVLDEKAMKPESRSSFAGEVDPGEIMKLWAKYPDKAKEIQGMITFKNEQTQGIVKRAILSAWADPENTEAILEQGISQVQRLGGTPTYMAQALEMHKKDPARATRYMQTVGAALFPESYKAAFGEAKDDEKLPASVQEYEFYKNLPKDEKKAFMLMKRGEKEPTADRLARLEMEAEIDRRQEQLGREDEAREKSISEATTKVTQLWDTASIYDQMIRSIDEGAGIGRVNQLFPTIRSATAQFEQAAKNLGLRVVSSTTFGALSEGELRLAMETAVPPISDPVEMRDYLVRKRAAQEKLADQMLAYIDHLRGGGTAASWISLQAKIRKERGDSDSGSQQPEQSRQPSSPAATPDEHGFIPGRIYDDDESGESRKYLGNNKWGDA